MEVRGSSSSGWEGPASGGPASSIGTGSPIPSSPQAARTSAQAKVAENSAASRPGAAAKAKIGAVMATEGTIG